MKHSRVISAAFADLREAVDWYDLHNFEIGSRLIAEFHVCVQKVTAQPLLYHPVYKEFRRVLLKPFPYLLYFRLDGETVVVMLLLHAARNPRLVRSLLDQRSYH
jgi:plasmid stabilization system protein ParE